MHKQADGPVIVHDALHMGQVLHPVHPGQGLGGGVAKDLQFRVEVSVVSGIEADGKIFGGVGEDFVLSLLHVEIRDALAGQLLRAGRQKNNQAFDRQPLLPAPQIVEPDQAEAQNRGGIEAIRSRGDGGHT